MEPITWRGCYFAVISFFKHFSQTPREIINRSVLDTTATLPSPCRPNWPNRARKISKFSDSRRVSVGPISTSVWGTASRPKTDSKRDGFWESWAANPTRNSRPTHIPLWPTCASPAPTGRISLWTVCRKRTCLDRGYSTASALCFWFRKKSTSLEKVSSSRFRILHIE